MDELTNYRNHGARALVILHEREVRKFLDTWRNAKQSGVPLPKTDDPTYTTYDTLLRHILHWAREYMVWICEMLELPGPEISSVPELNVVEAEANNYLKHLFKKWRKPLAQVSEERFYKPEFTSRWKVNYCVEAMLEHAVMHPIRHRFQLLELMEKK